MKKKTQHNELDVIYSRPKYSKEIVSSKIEEINKRLRIKIKAQGS